MTEILKFKDHYESEREIRYFLVEPTNYCNLDCMGCNRRDVILTRPLLHMPISDYEIILDKLEGQPIQQAKFQGLGETYFHPEVDKFFSLFKEANICSYVPSNILPQPSENSVSPVKASLSFEK